MDVMQLIRMHFELLKQSRHVKKWDYALMAKDI
jgi:hypothetical protein